MCRHNLSTRRARTEPGDLMQTLVDILLRQTSSDDGEEDPMISFIKSCIPSGEDPLEGEDQAASSSVQVPKVLAEENGHESDSDQSIVDVND